MRHFQIKRSRNLKSGHLWRNYACSAGTKLVGEQRLGKRIVDTDRYFSSSKGAKLLFPLRINTRTSVDPFPGQFDIFFIMSTALGVWTPLSNPVPAFDPFYYTPLGDICPIVQPLLRVDNLCGRCGPGTNRNSCAYCCSTDVRSHATILSTDL